MQQTKVRYCPSTRALLLHFTRARMSLTLADSVSLGVGVI